MANLLFDALFAPHLNAETAFLETPDGQNITHGQFLALAAQYAEVMRDLGLEPGDRVAVQVEKSPQTLALYAGAVQAGIVFLPLNTGYTAEELDYFISDSGARLVVCDRADEQAIKLIAQQNNADVLTLDADGQGSLSDHAINQNTIFKTIDRNPDDLAALLYTSGTTGRSKGAMLTHRNLLSNAETLVKAWGFDANDILIHALPIFHTHGLFVASNIALLAGCPIIFMPKFDLDQLIDYMPRATTLMGVPTFYTRLISDPRLTPELTQNMRLFISGSAPLLAETHIQFEQKTNHRILERYGMTETNMNTSNPYLGDRKAGTVGFPLDGVELRITDEKSGQILPQGDIGIIEVKGPNVCIGYWNMPEKTKEEFREDGFFITGDLGRVDQDGYVSIVGRNKDLIISGGLNIYPKEIEMIIDNLDGVIESAVIGIDHPDFGESPVAIIASQPKQAPDLVTIMSYIKQHLAKFKHPRKLIIVDALPRNTMGKVQKNILRETYKDCLNLEN